MPFQRMNNPWGNPNYGGAFGYEGWNAPGRAAQARMYNVFQGAGSWGTPGINGNYQRGGGIIGDIFHAGNILGGVNYVLGQATGTGYGISNVGAAWGGIGHRTRGQINETRAYEHDAGYAADQAEARRFGQQGNQQGPQGQGQGQSQGQNGGYPSYQPYNPPAQESFSRRHERLYREFNKVRLEEEQLLKDKGVQDTNRDGILDSRDDMDATLKSEAAKLDEQKAKLARKIGGEDFQGLMNRDRNDVINREFARAPQNMEYFFEEVRKGNLAGGDAERNEHFQNALGALQKIPHGAYGNIQLDKRYFNPADLQDNPATGAKAMSAQYQQALTDPHTPEDLVKIASAAYANMKIGRAVDPNVIIVPPPAPTQTNGTGAGTGTQQPGGTGAGTTGASTVVDASPAAEAFSKAMIDANQATTREDRIAALKKAADVLPTIGAQLKTRAEQVTAGKTPLQQLSIKIDDLLTPQEMQKLDPALQNVLRTKNALQLKDLAEHPDKLILTASTALADQSKGNIVPEKDVTDVIAWKTNKTPIPGLNPDLGPDGMGHDSPAGQSTGGQQPAPSTAGQTASTTQTADANVQKLGENIYQIGEYRYDGATTYRNIKGDLAIAKLQVALEANGFSTDKLGKAKFVDGVRGPTTDIAIADAALKLAERNLLPKEFIKGDISPENLKLLQDVLVKPETIEALKNPPVLANGHEDVRPSVRPSTAPDPRERDPIETQSTTPDTAPHEIEVTGGHSTPPIVPEHEARQTASRPAPVQNTSAPEAELMDILTQPNTSDVYKKSQDLTELLQDNPGLVHRIQVSKSHTQVLTQDAVRLTVSIDETKRDITMRQEDLEALGVDFAKLKKAEATATVSLDPQNPIEPAKTTAPTPPAAPANEAPAATPIIKTPAPQGHETPDEPALVSGRHILKEITAKTPGKDAIEITPTLTSQGGAAAPFGKDEGVDMKLTGNRKRVYEDLLHDMAEATGGTVKNGTLDAKYFAGDKLFEAAAKLDGKAGLSEAEMAALAAAVAHGGSRGTSLSDTDHTMSAGDIERAYGSGEGGLKSVAGKMQYVYNKTYVEKPEPAPVKPVAPRVELKVEYKSLEELLTREEAFREPATKRGHEFVDYLKAHPEVLNDLQAKKGGLSRGPDLNELKLTYKGKPYTVTLSDADVEAVGIPRREFWDLKENDPVKLKLDGSSAPQKVAQQQTAATAHKGPGVSDNLLQALAGNLAVVSDGRLGFFMPNDSDTVARAVEDRLVAAQATGINQDGILTADELVKGLNGVEAIPGKTGGVKFAIMKEGDQRAQFDALLKENGIELKNGKYQVSDSKEANAPTAGAKSVQQEKETARH